MNSLDSKVPDSYASLFLPEGRYYNLLPHSFKRLPRWIQQRVEDDSIIQDALIKLGNSYELGSASQEVEFFWDHVFPRIKSVVSQCQNANYTFLTSRAVDRMQENAQSGEVKRLRELFFGRVLLN